MTQALKQDHRIEPEPLPRPAGEPGEQPVQSRPRSHRRWFLGLLVATLTATAALKMPGLLAPPAPVPAAVPVKRQTITALGWLEPASSIVKLAAAGTGEAGRLARLEVNEGDLVEPGQVVAVLDTADKLKAQLQASKAQVDLKRAQLERVRVDTDNSLVARRMALVRAKADHEQAEAEFARQRMLVGREIATQATLEKRKRDLDVAKAQIEEADGALRRLAAKLASDQGLPQQIDVAIAERELAAAEADFEQIRVQLEQTSIRSPIRGRVITVLTRPGEKVSQDGVVELGSTDSMVAIAEVYQSDIGLIRVGQAVELKTDVVSAPVTGVVERVALKVKRQSVVNNDPATDTDARVVEVRITLDPGSSARVAGLTRLQVRAYFKLGSQ
jgi:HlyD family secretion protein